MIMPYNGFSEITTKVSISCESCGNAYSYNCVLKAGSRDGTREGAIVAARKNLNKKVERVNAGDYALVAKHKPCPQCGYVQSWMILPVRKRRGRNWGLGMGAASYMLAFLLLLLPDSSPLKNDFFGMFMFFGFPVIVFFVVRAIARKLYQPNKGREIPQQTQIPVVTF